MFRVQMRVCVLCFVFRGEGVCYVSCSEEMVFVMFRVHRRGCVICFRVQRRGCVICFVFREEGV